MAAADLVDLVHELERCGVAVWLDGGWGVDAVLGGQTRAHDDLDLVVQLQQIERLQSALAQRGFVLVGHPTEQLRDGR
jgi:lincosamide nucleotidyltransferase A/C/D/E